MAIPALKASTMPLPELNDLATRIRIRRTALNLTQQQVASEVGVSRVAVTKWENGDTKDIRLANVLALHQCLQCSLLWLISGRDTAGPENDVSRASQKLYFLTPPKLQAIDALLDVLAQGDKS